MINQLCRLAIADLRGKHFHIPHYQRGYRWGAKQNRQLLDDLTRFFDNPNPKSAFYCLQPITVKPIGSTADPCYEVIDGQQRLTTLRIILALEQLMDEDNDLTFSIHYETRSWLDDIFDSMVKSRDENKRYHIDLSENYTHRDIDSWHILEAARQIINWFQPKDGKRSISNFKGSFYEYLTNDKSQDKSVQVIWYELRDGSDPYETFKRLNDKSIRLNNAELIRAMFLSESSSFPCDPKWIASFGEDFQNLVESNERERKQSRIIEMWDIIESHLRNARFWAFINDDNCTSQYSCRIEYLFDLISQKDESQKDPLYTYLKFDSMLSEEANNDCWKLWLKVETCISLLKSWFEDRYYYHKIGFLIAEQGRRVLVELLSLSETLDKREFKKRINEKIITLIHDGGMSQGSILDYKYDENPTHLKRVFFLYNIESHRQQENLEFFPFELYKNQRSWTLEHIHAQNSDRIDQSNKMKWKEWLEENRKALANLAKRLPADERLNCLNTTLSEQQIDNKNYTFNDFKRVFDMVVDYFQELSQKENAHTAEHDISNLALLSGSTNSAISNSVFEVKRQMILKADANGVYIPYCTRKVFLKYYHPDDGDLSVQQNYYWGNIDRKNYLEDIKTVLNEYIVAKKTEVGNE